MANSAEINDADNAVIAQYNNLRLDAIDPTTGHNHNGVNSRLLNNGIIKQTNMKYASGDVLLISADTSRSGTDADWTKKKEIRIVRGGALRIKFDVSGGSAQYGLPASGQIWVNDIPVGAIGQAFESGASYSEDIENLFYGDLVQLYGKTMYGHYYLKNFRLYTINYQTEAVTLD